MFKCTSALSSFSRISFCLIYATSLSFLRVLYWGGNGNADFFLCQPDNEIPQNQCLSCIKLLICFSGYILYYFRYSVKSYPFFTCPSVDTLMYPHTFALLFSMFHTFGYHQYFYNRYSNSRYTTGLPILLQFAPRGKAFKDSSQDIPSNFGGTLVEQGENIPQRTQQKRLSVFPKAF